MYLDAQRNLDYDVSRSSWIGDVVDPSSFLEIWVTDGVNNRTGWSNLEYDRLIEEARTESRTQERYALYARAEEILLDELPCAPIYYYVSQNMVSPRLGGFESNLLNDQFPKGWYWMDDAELATRRTRQPPSSRPVKQVSGPRRGKYSATARAERAAAPQPQAAAPGTGDGE
jgi:ABC-type oligopeptide transport system substrate-binding subunit